MKGERGAKERWTKAGKSDKYEARWKAAGRSDGRVGGTSMLRQVH